MKSYSRTLATGIAPNLTLLLIYKPSLYIYIYILKDEVYIMEFYNVAIKRTKWDLSKKKKKQKKKTQIKTIFPQKKQKKIDKKKRRLS